VIAHQYRARQQAAICLTESNFFTASGESAKEMSHVPDSQTTRAASDRCRFAATFFAKGFSQELFMLLRDATRMKMRRSRVRSAFERTA
jgi:hypothetical protein